MIRDGDRPADEDVGAGAYRASAPSSAELAGVLRRRSCSPARVRAGVWQPREPQPRAAPAEMPTFHRFASDWLKAKLDGVLSENPIEANTEADYRWRLTRHLLPFFASLPARRDRS